MSNAFQYRTQRFLHEAFVVIIRHLIGFLVLMTDKSIKLSFPNEFIPSKLLTQGPSMEQHNRLPPSREVKTNKSPSASVAKERTASQQKCFAS